MDAAFPDQDIRMQHLLSHGFADLANLDELRVLATELSWDSALWLSVAPKIG